MPDDAKDGGIASIAPDLTAEWVAGSSAQKGLDHATDAERIISVRRFGVQWIVLSGGAVTKFPCDYTNAMAKVCRLPAAREAVPMGWKTDPEIN